ncbi:MAG: hypothetical protein QOI90_1524 [Mycobacterium sp.]|nr:hypothetical protein [Mycobacterium sp.]
MPVAPGYELNFAANSTYATIAIIVLGMALLGLMVYGAREWWLTGRPTLCLCLISGALASVVEPLWDHMGKVGGTACLVFRIAIAHCPRKYLYGAVGATISLNLLFEIPLTHARLYVYFGEQAFAPTGFPASWAFMNLGAILSGLALAKAPQVFRGIGATLIELNPAGNARPGMLRPESEATA